MKKIKAFLYVFKQSISSFSYYKDILNTNFAFSIKYLAILSIFAAITTSIGITSLEMPKITKFIEEKKPEIINIYPDNLELSSNNNEWSINQPQPYTIKMPNLLKDEEVKTPENLIVFDQNGTLNDFEKLNTLVLVNKTNLLVKTEEKIEVTPLQDIPNGTFNKQSYIENINKVTTMTKYIPAVMILAITVGGFFYFFVFRLLYLTFVAMALVVVNMFIKPDVEFKDLYRIALHSMTIPLIIEVLFIILGIFVTIPWFLITNIILGSLVIAKALKIDD